MMILRLGNMALPAPDPQCGAPAPAGSREAVNGEDVPALILRDIPTSTPMRIPHAILLLLLVNEALLLLGIVMYPAVLQADGLLGLGAATAILAVYGFLALSTGLASGKADLALVRRGLILGIISGVVLSLDLVSGYLLVRPAAESANTSLLTYGAFLLVLLGAGAWGAARTGRVRAGLTVALWCVITALLLWFCVEFASYYLFAQTATGAAFIQQEMQADFARSGAMDYAGFVMSDFYGAGFFHLLLGLILALLLGSLGALGGLLVRSRVQHWRLRTAR